VPTAAAGDGSASIMLLVFMTAAARGDNPHTAESTCTFQRHREHQPAI
jgi:hypothetical protein